MQIEEKAQKEAEVKAFQQAEESARLAMERKIESEKLRLQKAKEEQAKKDAQNKAVKDEVPSQKNKPHTSAPAGKSFY